MGKKREPFYRGGGGGGMRCLYNQHERRVKAAKTENCDSSFQFQVRRGTRLLKKQKTSNVLLITNFTFQIDNIQGDS